MKWNAYDSDNKNKLYQKNIAAGYPKSLSVFDVLCHIQNECEEILGERDVELKKFVVKYIYY